jgi:hypothetical protein
MLYLLERELVKVVVALMLVVTSATSGIPIVAPISTPTAKELSSAIIDMIYQRLELELNNIAHV